MTPTQEYRQIPLTHGLVAIVDAQDFERLSQHKWYARWNPRMRSWYAVRCGPWQDGKRAQIAMHREVLGLMPGDSQEADHVDPWLTLVNTRGNLRIATRSQQRYNQRRFRNNKTGYKGVTYDTQRKKYKANIRVDGRVKSLGYRDTPQAAHELYCTAAKQYRGEFARFE